MKPHSWKLKEIDCGPVGVNDFWHCTECDACGGPPWYRKKNGVFVWDTAPRTAPFYADGSGLKLSEDCDEAKEQISSHLMHKDSRIYDSPEDQ